MAKDEKPKDDEEKGGLGEGEEGQAEGEEGLNPPKRKLSKKLLIIIVAASILLLGGGVGALFLTGVIGGSKTAAEEQHGEASTEEHGATAPAEGAHEVGAAPAKEESKEGKAVFFSLGDILVNLSGDGKRPNFLKIKVVLELSSEKDLPALETMKPRIIDHFQVYLRELRVEDLRGSAGLYRLREELLLRVTEAAQPIRVRDVLFQEMLVQ